jgi:hypothetical protein
VYFCGVFCQQRRYPKLRVTLWEETKILKDFNNLLNTHFNQPQHVLCGHNAKEFDILLLLGEWS